MKTYQSEISPRLSLTAIKICKWASEETMCFTANICLDGKKAGDVRNSGHGGCHEMHFSDKGNVLAMLQNQRDQMPDYEYEGMTLQVDIDEIIDIMIAEFEARKHAKKYFTFINDDEGDNIQSFSSLKQGGKKVRADHPGIARFAEKNNITVVEVK
tara:strand:+ start:111 stop:578 length:468 start_codon:yes stop_codon:yes gene_type:complete